MSVFIDVQNYYGCNLHCNVCGVHSTPKYNQCMTDKTFEQVKLRLGEFDREIKDEYSVCLGYLGEPTLDKQLNERLEELQGVLQNGYLGIHTNGLLLENNYHILDKLDFLVLSILGGKRGKYSLKNNTGLDFEEYIDSILRHRENFSGEISIVLTLPEFSNREEVEEITYRLKGSGIIIGLNHLITCDTDRMRSNAEATEISLLDDWAENGINGLQIERPQAMLNPETGSCMMLDEMNSISVTGLYGLCCFPAFGVNTPEYSVNNTKLMDQVFGTRKQYCRDYIIKNQDIELKSCVDCILLRNLGIDMNYTDLLPG